MKIAVAFEEYRQSEIIARGLSPKTLETYTYSEKLAVGFFGNVELVEIREMDVREYYQHLLTWQKPDTARGNIICLRSVIKMRKRRGENVIDPESIKIPKRQKRAIEYLTLPEMEEFIDVISRNSRGYSKINRKRNVVIVKLLYATGLRVSELCRLNKNSFKNRQATIIGKSKEPRICFITEEVEKEIDEYLKMRNDNEPALFVANQTLKRVTAGTVRRVFKNACNNSDFENVHPHTIRHSFATRLLEKGVDIRYIADLMGHESLDTTKVYTHYTNPKLRQIYEIAMS